MLELSATCNGQEAHMGGTLEAARNAQAAFDVQTAGFASGRVELVEDGKPMPFTDSSTEPDSSGSVHVSWTSDGARHWFLAEVFGPGGNLWLLGNPIYVNWPKKP